ncbi:MAG TPA: GNAT family N-acetyltransferase, partial [Candidatus Eisenbacteria bacterium]|nr:GNAT family N-acetyltransferase [Candidatus Eisenbacteria bacterium]
DTVREDIGRGALWIHRHGGRVLAAMTIDDIQPEPYDAVEWRYGGLYVCVHRLAVDPAEQRKGIAGKMMAYAEEEAFRKGRKSVRLDTYGMNTAAVRFYEGLGYRRRGTIRLPKKDGEYICFEKSLAPFPPERFRALVTGSRSVRRFREDAAVSRERLEELVGMARLAPSGGNKQPLKFMLSSGHPRNGMIFPHLRWAGYMKDWDGPAEGERPAAYIVILGDREITEAFGTDHGIAAQTLMLGAASMGLAGCIIGSVDRGGLRVVLGIPVRYEILYVIAIGFPAEDVVIEDVRDGEIRYWRSEDGVHHVPKRSLGEIIFEP